MRLVGIMIGKLFVIASWKFTYNYMIDIPIQRLLWPKTTSTTLELYPDTRANC